MNNLKRIIARLKRLRRFLKKLNLEPAHLFFPSLLAFVAAGFEGGAFALLVPTINGLMESNYKFAYSARGLGWILNQFPGLFLNNNSAVFIFLTVLIFVFVITKNIFAYSSSVLITYRVRSFSHQLRCLVFDAYIGFRKSFFDRNSVGDLQNILIGYTEQIAFQFKIFQTILYQFFVLIMYLIVMGMISWRATLFVIILFPVLIFAFKKLVSQIKSSSNLFASHFSALGKKILNSLSCIPLIKATGSENKERAWFKHTSDEVRKQQIHMDVRALLIMPVQEVFFVACLFLVMGFIAWLSIRKDDGGVAGYLVFFVVARRAMGCIGQITAFQSGFASIEGPLRQVMKVFEERGANSEAAEGTALDSFHDQIEVKRLTFRYRDRDVLSNVSFKVKKNQMVALVGQTGSGKSTLAQLFMRFYEPPRGTIFIDGNDILDLQISSWRKKIAFITQDNYLFDASLEVNLKYGCEPEPTAAEILSALDKAQLSELLSRLPQGLATEVGERGVQLSGGEKQRLAIARVILRNPEILILDEATSALDSQTEKLVQEAIDQAAHGRTTIVIAHRLATIQKADCILVLDHGALVESGSFSDLMVPGSHFKNFWDFQMDVEGAPKKESPDQ